MDSSSVDLLALGYGPSHLSLLALLESPAVRSRWPGLRVHVLEREPRFGWHPGMLLRGARMQIAFSKDLVTLEDPTSPYSFLAFLHRIGRLEEFLNLREFHPTRQEFEQYLRWAADELDARVTYAAEVQSVQPVAGPDGYVDHLRVHHRHPVTHASSTRTARSVSLALGGRPAVPACVAVGDGSRVFHTNDFLGRVGDLVSLSAPPRRLLVVGGGQSAAEAFVHLAERFPAGEVTLAHRGFALMPAISTPLVNEIFHTNAVDLHHNLSRVGRAELLRTLRHTNYACVDEDDLEVISRLLYEQRVAGGARLTVQRFSELVACRPQQGTVGVQLRDTTTGAVTGSIWDAVVLATGYDFQHVADVLHPLADYLAGPGPAGWEARRDYSLVTSEALRSKVFLIGATEPSHGLTATLLSILPRRAAEILDACAEVRAQRARPAILSSGGQGT